MVIVETIGEVNRGKFFFRPLHQLNSSLAPKGACSYYLKSGGLALTPLWSRQPKQVYGQAPFGVLGGMMVKNGWIKLHTDILNNHKIGRLPADLWRLNIEIKLIANDEGFLPTEGDIAFYLRRDPSTLEDGLKELARVGLIAWAKGDDWGRWFIPGFTESQGPAFVSPYPENWDYLRQQALTRDNGLCLYCGNIATHVDHIIPVTKDGPHTLDNLASACEHCNKSKNNSDLFEWYPKQPFLTL